MRSPPFHYSHGEVWFSSHKNNRNTMNITYAKIKKKSRSRFFKPQPARASLMNNEIIIMIFHKLDQSPPPLPSFVLLPYPLRIVTLVLFPLFSFSILREIDERHSVSFGLKAWSGVLRGFWSQSLFL